jgi:hypothetical protein
MKRVLVPRFDSLGDLILLEGFLRRAAEHPGSVSLTLLVRQGMLQLKPLFATELTWLSSSLNPYTSKPDVGRAEELLALLKGGVWDEIWFTTFSKTWPDILLAYRFPAIRQVHLGALPLPDPQLALLLRQLNLLESPKSVDLVVVEKECHEFEKLRAFLGRVLDEEAAVLPEPSLRIPGSARSSACAWLKAQNLRPKSFVACIPAGGENVRIKSLPADCFAGLLAWLKNEMGFETLLVGHSAERGEISQVKDECIRRGVEPRVWIGFGDDLDILGALLQESLFYFGNDTGPMHLAAALGIPVVAVFGGGTWPRFLPIGKASVAVREMPCFGCAWNCCFGDAPCVAKMPVETVRAALGDLIRRLSSPDRQLKIFRAEPYGDETEDFIRKAAAQYRALQLVRSREVKHLETAYWESEADRAARLRVIEEQSKRIAQMDRDIVFLNDAIRAEKAQKGA